MEEGLLLLRFIFPLKEFLFSKVRGYFIYAVQIRQILTAIMIISIIDYSADNFPP